jgi:hypothetical protein
MLNNISYKSDIFCHHQSQSLTEKRKWKRKSKSRKRGRKHCQIKKNQSGERKDRVTNSKLRKSIQKRIKVLEQQQADGHSQAKNLINIQVVRLNLLSQIHPFITECQKLIKRLPKGLLKRPTQAGTTTKKLITGGHK